jgi:hypothetical protein
LIATPCSFVKVTRLEKYPYKIFAEGLSAFLICPSSNFPPCPKLGYSIHSTGDEHGSRNATYQNGKPHLLEES